MAGATTALTFNIATTDLPRVVAAIGATFNYQPVLIDMLGNQTPNPETPAQFAHRMIVQTIISWVITYESQQAAAAAVQTATASAQQIGVS